MAKLSRPFDWVSVAENRLSACPALNISIVASRLWVVPCGHSGLSIKRKSVDILLSQYRPSQPETLWNIFKTLPARIGNTHRHRI
ncbi:MAG: hypothetical protein MZV70_35320 [Desulfobacterales bacterium]|nr:hypothetical protein [Desulfobacterales bacterium]